MDKTFKPFLICIAAVIVLLLFAMASCTTAKKATNYMLTHPKTGAAFCADQYPAQEKTDSSGYKKSIATIDSLLQAMQNESELNDEERDAMLENIELLASQLNPNCDSITDGLFKLAAEDKKKINMLEKQKQQLTAAIKNIKPVESKVRDRAVEKLLEMQLADALSASEKLSAKLEQTENELSSLKSRIRGKVMIPWLWLVVAAIIIGGLTLLRIKKLITF